MENKEKEVDKKLVEVTEEEYLQLQEIKEKEKEIQEKEAELEKRQKEISDKELILEAKKTAKSLKNTQKMVSVLLPISELNPHDKFVPVTINGYTWKIERGKEVLVPQEVKNILREAKYI